MGFHPSSGHLRGNYCCLTCARPKPINVSCCIAFCAVVQHCILICIRVRLDVVQIAPLHAEWPLRRSVERVQPAADCKQCGDALRSQVQWRRRGRLLEALCPSPHRGLRIHHVNMLNKTQTRTEVRKQVAPLHLSHCSSARRSLGLTSKSFPVSPIHSEHLVEKGKTSLQHTEAPYPLPAHTPTFCGLAKYRDFLGVLDQWGLDSRL